MDLNIPPGVQAWIESDDVFGLTAGDTEVATGDLLDVNERVQLGNCREWYVFI